MATNVVLKKDGRMNSVAKHMTLGVETEQAIYQQQQGTRNSVKAFEMISDLAHAQKISFAEHPDQPVNASSHCFSNQLGKFYYWLPHEVIEVWSTFLWRCVLDVSLFCLEYLLVGEALSVF